MGRFDLSALALKAVCPTNDILYDDKGLPSIMVRIPKFKISDVIAGGADSVHPAFIVNGVEVNEIYISKYQNVVNNGRAYSLPCEDPKASINIDQAHSYCTAKGDGWHLMTLAEWAAIALWCKKNGFLPKGNNNYGKDTSENNRKAIPLTYGTGSDAGKVFHVATGSGPLTWSHDGTLGGIWDLNGNVSEWTGGVRTVYGEIQILANNNAADLDNSQASSSAQWKAIDATTGELITPDGKGTTTNSVKLDYVSYKWTYSTAIKNSLDDSRNCTFVSVTCDSTISAAAQSVLKALTLMPDDTAFDYEGDYFYANNGAAERAFHSGGNYGGGAVAGVFCRVGGNTRSVANVGIGFRAAYVKLPSA